MKKFRTRMTSWYWRALYVGMTIGALVAAAAAPNNWD